jgi:hypothetical protein
MRLNSAIRAEITRGAFKLLFARSEALAKQEHALCIKCYQAALPVSFRDKLDALQAEATALNRNQRWLNFGLKLNFNVGGQYHSLSLPRDSEFPVPLHAGWNDRIGKPIDREKHSKLVDDVWALAADWETYKKDLKVAEVTMKQLLKGVASTESLFKVWPEGKKFYSTPPLTPTVKIGLPAVQVEALNKMIGLTA